MRYFTACVEMTGPTLWRPQTKVIVDPGMSSSPGFGACTQFKCLSYERKQPEALVVMARHSARKDSAKIRNRRMKKKFNGTSARPRLSVFCSGTQLYAVLVDDSSKKCLFYGSTLQRSIREDPNCTTAEAAARLGDALVKFCSDHHVVEISYDRNGFARGERIQAFELAVARHGFVLR